MAYPIEELIVTNDGIEKRIRDGMEKNRKGDFTVRATPGETVTVYWDATEPEEGRTRYAADSAKIYRCSPTDLCVDFCEAHGMEPREHALCYDDFFPAWLWGRPDEKVKHHIEKRMCEISLRYVDRIPTIEVTNEVFRERGEAHFRGFFREYEVTAGDRCAAVNFDRDGKEATV